MDHEFAAQFWDGVSEFINYTKCIYLISKVKLNN